MLQRTQNYKIISFPRVINECYEENEIGNNANMLPMDFYRFNFGYFSSFYEHFSCFSVRLLQIKLLIFVCLSLHRHMFLFLLTKNLRAELYDGSN